MLVLNDLALIPERGRIVTVARLAITLGHDLSFLIDYVDGQQARILRANYALRALELEAGSHRVELVYDPLSVKVGCVVSAGALMIVLCLVAWTVMRRRSQES